MDLDPLPILRRLEELLGSYGPTLTAYSGGVDSTVVAVAAHRVHGERALAVTGVSPTGSWGPRR